MTLQPLQELTNWLLLQQSKFNFESSRLCEPLELVSRGDASVDFEEPADHA